MVADTHCNMSGVIAQRELKLVTFTFLHRSVQYRIPNKGLHGKYTDSEHPGPTDLFLGSHIPDCNHFSSCIHTTLSCGRTTWNHDATQMFEFYSGGEVFRSSTNEKPAKLHIKKNTVTSKITQDTSISEEPSSNTCNYQKHSYLLWKIAF